MDKRQNSHNRMHRAVSGILESNQQIVATIPGLNEAHIALDRLIAETDEHKKGQAKNGAELTTEKNQARAALDTSLIKVSRAVVAFATNSTDPNVKLYKDKYRYSDNEIKKIPEKDVFTKAYLLYGDALPVASNLSPFVTSKDVDQLKENADEFNLMLPQRRIQMSKSTTSTKNLEESISKADELLRDTIDVLVNPLEFSYPDFYKSYKNARNIVDPAYRKQKPEGNGETGK